MASFTPAPQRRWRFGRFEFLTPSRELLKSGVPLRLQDQPARALELLLARQGDLVTREELRNALWPADTSVDFERSLNAAVAKLRQVLSDSAEEPRFVETVARKGYRWIAPLEGGAMVEERSQWQPQSSDVVVSESISRRNFAQWVPLLAGVLGVIGFSWWAYRTRTYNSSPAVSFTVAAPKGTQIHPMSAISPDGQKIAFVAVDESGKRTLWLRPLSSLTSIHLEGTDDALMPFFSPDSQQIAFFSSGRLMRISAGGGPPQLVCPVQEPAGGTWSQDNLILFSQRGRLYRIPAGGGTPTEIPRPVPGAGESVVETWPQFLPGGKRYIVSSATHKGQLNALKYEIQLGSLNTSGRDVLVRSRGRGFLTREGYLLYRPEDALVAQKINPDQGRLIGQPIPIARDVSVSSGGVLVSVKAGLPVGVVPAPFSVSENGALAYHTNPPSRRRLAWFDRQGRRLSAHTEERDYMQIALSPDEQWAALSVRESRLQWSFWLLNLRTNVLSRLTFGPGRDADGAWSPDSRKLVFGRYQAEKGESIDMMELVLGEREVRTIHADGQANKPESWSPDGGHLIFRQNEVDVLLLAGSKDRKTSTLFPGPGMKHSFRFSPDGKWVAYVSAESGVPEVYVSRFPGLTQTRQVSKGEGWAPLWRSDGKELFYMTKLGEIMSVLLHLSDGLEAEAPTRLLRFESRHFNMPQYAVADEGRKFLVIEAPDSQPHEGSLVVVAPWTALLPK
jgi:eukaryotic-like serine/threonine-protein kinase